MKTLQIEAPKLYGYFDKDGNVYKIYQPSQKKYKFIKVKAHLQGFDQLEYNQPYFDYMFIIKRCYVSKEYRIQYLETIAPDSENTVIKPYIIKFKKEIQKVITLFDNDEAGYKAIDKY